MSDEMKQPLLKKSYVYYFIVVLIYLCAINISTVHQLRLGHLRAQYFCDVSPSAEQCILLYDYSSRLYPSNKQDFVSLANCYKLAGDNKKSEYVLNKAQALPENTFSEN